MGSPKFSKKKYNTPKHPWKEERIESERDLIKKYGLKNHKEVWKAKTYLGRYRQQARDLLARLSSMDPQVKKESDQLLLHLTNVGVLPSGSSLDDVLALEIESILSRRLQTLVYLKGFSNTVSHSRQLINHGHIGVNQRKVTIPGYIVTKDEEGEIGYTVASPLNELSHPARPKTDVFEPGAQKEKIIKTDKKEKPIEKPSKEEITKKPVEETSKQVEEKKEEIVEDKGKKIEPEEKKPLEKIVSKENESVKESKETSELTKSDENQQVKNKQNKEKSEGEEI